MTELSTRRIRDALAHAQARPRPSDDAFRASVVLPDVAWMYLTADDRPGLLLVERRSETPRVAMRLAQVIMQRGLQCRVETGSARSSIRAATVECTSDDSVVQEFFIRILPATLHDLTETSSPAEIESSLRRLRDLLTAARPDRLRDLQGLWAELLTIEQSADPTHLVQAWRSDPHDDFDFLDEAAAVEVKSTRGNARRHRFSSAQLTAPPETLVLSYMLDATDTGVSLMELFDSCSARMAGTTAALKLVEIVLSGVGDRLPQTEAVRFDRQLAIQRLQAYRAVDVPALRPPFPPGVSAVSFDVDLSAAPPHEPDRRGAPSLWRSALGIND